MTEEEWLTCGDPMPMLALLKHEASERKLRLLTVASCRHLWNLFPTACRRAGEVLEQFADGRVSEAEYRASWSEADVTSRMCVQDPPDAITYAVESVLISIPPTTSSVEYALSTAAIARGCCAAEQLSEKEYDRVQEATSLRAAREQAALLRDIFGNPFRPLAFDPAWRTETVVGIARGIYEERAFERMPILADALQEAGCEHPDILSHCREPGEHVRGCWVVDLVLEK